MKFTTKNKPDMRFKRNRELAKKTWFAKYWLSLIILLVGMGFAVSITQRENKEFLSPVDETPDGVLGLINQERLRLDLNPLIDNDLLNKSAQLKADDLCELGYWAHTNPDGVEPWELIRGVGYNYAVSGENLARDFPDDVGAFKGFVNSPIHYALIIDKRYEDIGIGRCREYLVVHFGVL